MRHLIAVLVAAGGLATACGGGASASSDTAADVAQIKNLEVTLHQAQTAKNVDTFMSIWEQDATLAIGGKTYTGTESIRGFWATMSPAFKPENNWIELTATPRITASVDGDEGKLHFECYFLDIPSRVVKGISTVDSTVVRRDNRWLLKTVGIAPLATLSAAG
jgi:hypothetical protein